MAFVIAQPCIDIKDGDCTNACPVDCIYEGGRMFYIHPDECIDCGLCLSICPVDAIYDETDIPAKWLQFIAVNREFFGPEISNIGSPGGTTPSHVSTKDHPLIRQAGPCRANLT